MDEALSVILQRGQSEKSWGDMVPQLGHFCSAGDGLIGWLSAAPIETNNAPDARGSDAQRHGSDANHRRALGKTAARKTDASHQNKTRAKSANSYCDESEQNLKNNRPGAASTIGGAQRRAAIRAKIGRAVKCRSALRASLRGRLSERWRIHNAGFG